MVGIVNQADLNKAPTRLILYVILSEIESKLRRVIDREWPNDSWLTELRDTGIPGNIERLRERDAKDNTELDKLFYLEFSALLLTVEKTQLFAGMGFNLAEFVAARMRLNKLRISIMHMQPLVVEGVRPHTFFRDQIKFAKDFAARIPVTSLKRTT